jgi:hypothetical protein
MFLYYTDTSVINIAKIKNQFCMLQSISWNQYITSIVLLLAFYYAYVGYKYYRWELLALIGIRKIEPGTATIPVEELKGKLVSENPEDYLPKVSATNIMQVIKDEINAYLAGTADSMPSKTELINSLQAIVAKHPAIKLSGNNNSLHQFILAETETIHPGAINQDDLNIIFSA